MFGYFVGCKGVGRRLRVAGHSLLGAGYCLWGVKNSRYIFSQSINFRNG